MVRLPARHNSGNSQRGSADCSRPTDRENQTPSLKSSRCFRFCSGTGATSCNSSGAAMAESCWRMKAPAICSGLCRANNSWANCASFSVKTSVKDASDSKRSRSRAMTSSAVGGVSQVALIDALSNSRSARRRAFWGTISAQTPLRPARPVRPLRCNKVSLVFGISAWMTSSRLGRSIPRAATSVATQTRARPSRIACNAWERSFWLSSPDRATTAKPRLLNRLVR